MKNFWHLLPVILFFSQCRNKDENFVSTFPGKPEVPSSIKKEHDNLLEKLYKFTSINDSTGLAAKKLYNLLQHHFNEEEDYVLPPLGLLPQLTNGKIPEQTKNVIALTEKLKSQLSHMSAEHQLIEAYLDEIKQADSNLKYPEIIELEKEIHKHAKIEEEVLFPASILVGDYLKLKTPNTNR
ncbi:Hemerythrin HHE cation binding domain-containing protein [Daejeonella rubra]|uniref:Hemerythrin HHE cation binding domain-containing protein n=1 Tax=Daejeonella rubra TaxID=990371 RepID=A0A1G9SIR3_9SPHI|nr:hemerythrin domain-containing protein [Daejeonella rubra]SDM35200.1 Hemerythrin HHE cation binding domain-containing protein [Daejeonella rubra]